MFIECLDPRRLMAAAASSVTPPIGLDATFGDGGLFTFRGRFAATGPMARGDGATFVCGELRRKGAAYDIPYVVKIKDDGTADTSFGANGYARLPFQDVLLENIPNENAGTQPSFAFTSVAYDSGNHSVYVAAVRRSHYGDGTTLALTRLTGSGAIDTTYGSRRGTFSYAPPLPAGELSTASARATAMNPLADGSVVLAVDRQTHQADTFDDANTAVGEESLALIKLRPNGTPDTAYGTGGVTQLLGGTVGPLVPDRTGYLNTRAIRRGFFNDVTTDASGVTHVLLRYETGDTSTVYNEDDENTEIATGRFDVKARTVSATGVVDDSKSYAWRLFDSRKTRSHARVTAVIPDGDAVRALVTGEPGYGKTAALYTLRPNQNPVAPRFAPPGISRVLSIAHSADGHWFAFNDGLVVRLNRYFMHNDTFGESGVVAVGSLNHIPIVGVTDSDDTNKAVLADEQGRFLALDNAGLVRFA